MSTYSCGMELSIIEEESRIARLRDAEAKATQLFEEVGRRAMIRSGIAERQLSDEIYQLAHEMFGVTRYWHKRVVRAGVNTLQPFHENPPDRMIGEGDVVFLDLGPVFEEWEADFGRTYLLDDDPDKIALRDALPRVWQAGRDYFDSHPDVTGAELYDYVVGLTHAEGFDYASTIAGHLVGEFPHKKIIGDGVDAHIMPGSDQPMRRRDQAGRLCHWILEIHLANRDRGFGGFYEQLLDVPRSHSA